MNNRSGRKNRTGKRRGVAILSGAVFAAKNAPFPPYLQFCRTFLLKEGGHMEIQTVIKLEQDPYDDYVVRYLAERVENDGAVYRDGDVVEVFRCERHYCTVEMVEMTDSKGAPFLRAVILNKGMDQIQRQSSPEIWERIGREYELIHE